MVAAFTTPAVTAVVTWNPLLASVIAVPGRHVVFNSSQIPGEIIDIMVVNTATLKDNPDFGKALVGIWYEAMGLMADESGEGAPARAAMAKVSGTDLAGFNVPARHHADVLYAGRCRRLHRQRRSAQDNGSGADLLLRPQAARRRRQEQGRDRHRVPGGEDRSVPPSNVKLRFGASFMKMAADGKL